VMRIETQITKNKIFKIQVLKTYLTIFLLHFYIFSNDY
jgi:hypothetical protein